MNDKRPRSPSVEDEGRDPKKYVPLSTLTLLCPPKRSGRSLRFTLVQSQGRDSNTESWSDTTTLPYHWARSSRRRSSNAEGSSDTTLPYHWVRLSRRRSSNAEGSSDTTSSYHWARLSRRRSSNTEGSSDTTLSHHWIGPTPRGNRVSSWVWGDPTRMAPQVQQTRWTLIAQASGRLSADLAFQVIKNWAVEVNKTTDYKITVGPCKAKPSQKPNTYPANKKNNKDSGGGSKRGGKGKKNSNLLI